MSISRTGTFTSSGTSGSAGEQGTYFYDKNSEWGSAGSSGYAGVENYSNDDLNEGSIFADIESRVSVTFTGELNPTTVTTFTKNTSVNDSNRNIKGTIGLTHFVSTVTGSSTDGNNLKAFKLTSSPESIDGLSNESANQEFVEMSVEPESEDNITFVLSPVTNLSSNTTYFLRIDDENLLDATQAVTQYDIEKGFTTDNTKTFVTTNEFYIGFKSQFTPLPLSTGETSRDIDVDDNFSLDRTNSPTGFTIKKIQGGILTYQLSDSSYKANVSYTSANPVVISSVNHGLNSNDIINVYDIVSGDSVNLGKYTITKLTSDTFSIPVDGTRSTAGRLNYRREVKKDDEFISQKTVDNVLTTIRKKASNASDIERNSITELVNNTFTVIDNTNVKGKLIRVSGENVSYVPVDLNGNITTDSFANNTIIDLENINNGIISDSVRFHIKANTNPDHNVHPFHSSSPNVISTFPEEGESFPRKLTVINVTRREHIATVTTNHPHNLSVGDDIKILGSTQSIYNKETKVLGIPTSTQFTYDLDSTSDFSNVQSPAPGNIKLQVSTDGGSTYIDRFNALFVNFSQSMNTSTITVANNTHLISANGTSATFTGGQDSASSTIQLSDDGFDTIENCTAVTASTGNSVFAIIPETLKRNHEYRLRVKTSVQDLGQTNVIYQFTTTEGISTGNKVVDPSTGLSTITSIDEDPPDIRKISITTDSGTTGFAGKVLESNVASEIDSPDDYQDVAINLDDEFIKVQFSETMNVETVTVATTNTNPIGTIQFSCDDFNTVVQMASSLIASSTDEDNDTFVYKPVANLSANATYTYKILKTVRDGAPDGNQMQNDNVSAIRVLTLNSNPASAVNHYSTGEIISGVRTATVKANTGTPTSGVTTGDTFFGRTSKGKGKILDLTSNATNVLSVRFTEIVSTDGSIKPLVPGEICEVNSTCNFTLDNTAISDPPQGNVISYSTGSRKIVYRDNNSDDAFVSANSSAERVLGRTSNGEVFASSSGSEGIVGPGFKTTTTAIVANVFFTNTNGDVVSTSAGNKNSINAKSNITFTFNQTMNVESFNFNAVDSTNRDSYNLILSYDSGFANVIPLSTNFTTSNNDTAITVQPSILTNSSLQLTSNKNIFARVTQSAKNKGDMNLTSVFSVTNYANTATNLSFNALNAYVITKTLQEIELGTGSSGSMPVKATNVDRTGVITIHFNEVPLLSTFAIGSGNEIQLATASGFGSGNFITVTLRSSGAYGTQISLIPTVALAASTTYYLRVVTGVGGTNEGGQGLGSTVYFNSFTTGT